ncbi:YnfE family protein [Bacillus glycinifermentans]|uniref:YnfE family protein n=1 Tax=Bacillus glycinifermentans TaxID=1664069 RepID=UPI001E3E6372|nr:YnfE family protein [Bacillus glycinifermentans]
MEELKGYVEAVKRNMETMNADDYDGKEDDLRRQQEEIERYERLLKEQSISADAFDRIVSAPLIMRRETFLFHSWNMSMRRKAFSIRGFLDVLFMPLEKNLRYSI